MSSSHKVMSGMCRLLVVGSADKWLSQAMGYLMIVVNFLNLLAMLVMMAYSFPWVKNKIKEVCISVSPAEPSEVIPAQEAPRSHQDKLMPPCRLQRRINLSWMLRLTTPCLQLRSHACRPCDVADVVGNRSCGPRLSSMTRARTIRQQTRPKSFKGGM